MNDNAYSLFVAIETSMRSRLTENLRRSITALSEPEAEAKSSIVCFVCEDVGVNFCWSTISIDIHDDIHNIELLREIVGKS